MAKGQLVRVDDKQLYTSLHDMAIVSKWNIICYSLHWWAYSSCKLAFFKSAAAALVAVGGYSTASDVTWQLAVAERVALPETPITVPSVLPPLRNRHSHTDTGMPRWQTVSQN